jgi:lactate dehydrogenase-like 2-hydroxyacid dehydrogenase
MSSTKADLIMVGPKKQLFVERLAPAYNVHVLNDVKDRDAFLAETADRVRALAVTYSSEKVSAEFMQRLPKLEIVSSFGVGYDHVDAKWAGAHGIVVTNTPDVLNEEVADTALGLLLCTVREFPQAERYLRAGKWEQKSYPLSGATLRDRTAGIVGMGRIGKAIARRLEAFGVPVVYHSRRPVADVSYRHYPDLVAMAKDVDTLIVIVPGGAETRNMINAQVLEALGPNGILINVARGSVVDEPALVKALQDKKIRAAGLDVFVHEPKVPKELMEMEGVVLFPHLGSASVYTRTQMDHLVVDNLLSWAAGKGPLTPVPEALPKSK